MLVEQFFLFLCCFFINIDVDYNQRSDFPHFWELGVGSSHAALSTRADWRDHIKLVHEALGIKYVRYHAALDDSSLYYSGQLNNNQASYFDVLSTYSYLISIGVRPVVELSFTPPPVSPKGGTCNHFSYNGCETVPTDFKLYQTYIYNFTKTMVDYFGIDEVKQWYFEVYNEADLHWPFATYYKLYQACAFAVKNVSKELRVGGPSSAFGVYVEHLINSTKNDNTPIDFASTHAYPTTGGASVGELRGLVKQISAIKYIPDQLPFFITEWNALPSSRSSYHDEHPQAAFFIAAIDTVSKFPRAPDMLAWWAFSDVFAEVGLPAHNVPFHGGFGLVNLYGVPKPTFRAMEFMRQSGNVRLEHSFSQNTKTNITIIPLWDDKKKKFSLTLAHHACPNLKSCPSLKSENIQIAVKNLPATNFNCTKRTISENSANPKQKWIEMGSPNYLHPNEVEILMKASEPITSTQSMEKSAQGDLILKFLIDPYTVVHFECK